MASDDQTPTLLEGIQHVIEARLRTLHTWLPALVESYDEDKQLVDVTAQIALPYLDPDDGVVKYEPAPRIARCPVGFMGAGGFRITLPIEPKKTTGVLLFAECPIADWLLKGDAVEPSATRRFHISDAMFIPMLKPHSGKFTDVPRSDSMTVGRDGGPQLVVTKDEVQLGGTPSSPPDDHVALATPTKDELKKLHDAINAGFSALRSDLQSIGPHTHLIPTGLISCPAPAYTNAGPVTVPPSLSLSALQGPQDAGAVGDVKASVTKAK